MVLPNTIVSTDGEGALRLHYTPKEPEPAAPVMGVCEQCGAFTFDKDAAMCPCGGFILFPKEPKAEPVVKENFTAVEPEGEPGLVSDRIDISSGFYGVNGTCLAWVMSRADFHHIELKSGATVTTLSAFAENDPPVKAWFRETK